MITPVGTNWVVSTIAGQNRSYGYADGTNSVARFAFPYGVTLDKAGNLYVADRSNDAIRKITPVGTNWVVTTIAGLAGSLGFADGTNSNARFDVPSAIAIGSSNLYVTDLYNFTVRKLTPQGTNWVVTTIAGSIGNGGSVDGTNNAAEFYYPQGIAVDTNENVYIADTENSTIRKLTQIGTNWVVTTLAGVAGTIGGADGAGNQASFHYTADVAVDFGGNLYVSDNNNEIIRMGWPSPIPNPTIAFTLSNSVGLFWADNGHAYTLQTNGDLTTTNWADCEAALNLTNGTNQATIPITAGNIFFRLKN